MAQLRAPFPSPVAEAQRALLSLPGPPPATLARTCPAAAVGTSRPAAPFPNRHRVCAVTAHAQPAPAHVRMEERSRHHVLACAPLLPRPSLSSYTHNQPWTTTIVRRREPTPPSPSFRRRRPSARVPFPDASASLRSGAGLLDSSPSSPAQRPATPLAQPRRVPRALARARRRNRAAQGVQARSP